MILTATSGIKLYLTTFQAAFLNQVFGSVRAVEGRLLSITDKRNATGKVTVAQG
jgi:hypothetical protein